MNTSRFGWGLAGSLLLLIFLSACSFESLLPPLPTSYIIPTVTDTPTPRPSAAPTLTPTEIAVARAGTPLPPDRAAITAQNAAALAPFARQGKGIALCLTLSADGSLLAVGSTRGISLFDGDTLDEKLFINTALPQQALAFSADGSLLASAGQDGLISLWSLPQGSLLRQLKNDVYSYATVLQFSPDGSRLISSDIERITHIWQVADGREVERIVENARVIRNLSFFDQADMLFSWAPKEPLKIWNLNTGRKVREIFVGQDELGKETINGAFSADGAFFAANSGQRVRIYRAKNGTTRQLIRLKETARYVVLSPDGSRLAVISDRHVSLYQVESKDEPQVLDLPSQGMPGLQKVCFSADGEALWLIADAPARFDLHSGEITLSGTADFAADYVPVSLFSVDGSTERRRVLLNGTLQRLDALGQIQTSLQLAENPVSAAAIAPDGSRVALSNRELGVSLWDGSGEWLKKLDDWTVNSLSFSDTGLLAGSLASGRVFVWQVESGELRYSFENEGALQQVLLSADGGRLLARTTGAVSLWSLPDQKLLATWQGCAMQMSPDGKLLAVVHSSLTEHSIDVFASDSLKQVTHIENTRGFNLAFSADGGLLASASDVVSLWSLPEGTLIRQFSSAGLIGRPLFIKDDHLLALTAWDGSVRFWGIP